MKKIKTIIEICSKIKTLGAYLPKNIFFTKNLINELVLLNLKIEKILFNKKNNLGNPVLVAYKLLYELKERLKELSNLKNFSDDEKKVNIKKFCREISHKIFFKICGQILIYRNI